MRNNSNRLFKRLMILFAGIIGIFGLSSCTNTFTTNQDQASQLYAYYGNLYATSVDLTDDDDGKYNLTLQNSNRETLFSTLSESNGYSSIDKDFLNFMNDKVETFVEENYTLWTSGTLGEHNTEEAMDIATSVAIYAGLNEGKTAVSSLFTNFDTWYNEALEDDSIGILKSPSAGYVTTMKSTLNTTVSSLRAGFSPVDGTFTHNGSTVYIEGKTWGEAFSEYGFFEGLLVYPFAWIIHQISNIDLSNGWFQILAIFVVTILARSITVISTLLQTKTQAKQQRIQPMLNELRKKYPNSQEDREQARALAMEQSQLMKKNKVHPFLPLLLVILQFPIFICVWAALQDSAALASGSWLGLSLTTTVSTCFTSYSSTPGALTGIFIFIIMTIGNILSSSTSLFFNSWRSKNFGSAQQIGPDGQPMDQNKTMKYMTIIMSVFVIFMGWSLPAAMGIYWFMGSIISICQTLIMELVQTRNRHNISANTGDGSTLAAVRRSKHHSSATKAEADKKAAKKNKSDKPMWR